MKWKNQAFVVPGGVGEIGEWVEESGGEAHRSAT